MSFTKIHKLMSHWKVRLLFKGVVASEKKILTIAFQGDLAKQKQDRKFLKVSCPKSNFEFAIHMKEDQKKVFKDNLLTLSVLIFWPISDSNLPYLFLFL